MSKLKYTIRKLLRTIVNTVSYCRYAWRNHGDPNWDWEYSIDLLKWKLEKLATSIGRNNFLERTDEVVAEIREAITCIDQWLGDDGFFEELQKKHEAKWGAPLFTFGPKAITKEDMEQCKLESSAIFNETERHKEMAREKLFNLLTSNIERWWD